MGYAMQKKCSCVKEPTSTIPVARVIEKIDSLFARDDMQEVGRVLEYWQNEARALGDSKGLLSILNEQLGYYRKLGDKQKGLSTVDEMIALLECEDESVSTATMYLNLATTMKAFGKAQEGIQYYLKAQAVYEAKLDKDDFRLAGLYNNMATALCELERFEEAMECYQKAVDTLKQKQVCGELAVTYVNMAHLHYDKSQKDGLNCEDEIYKLLDMAFEVLDDGTLERDGNYAFICSKCAPSYGYFGYFLQREELEKRANEIYKK